MPFYAGGACVKTNMSETPAVILIDKVAVRK